MLRVATRLGSERRRPVTRRRSGRARARSRTCVGSQVQRRGPVRDRIFLAGSAQHVESATRFADWLAAVAMLLAVASWGVLASLLTS